MTNPNDLTHAERVARIEELRRELPNLAARLTTIGTGPLAVLLAGVIMQSAEEFARLVIDYNATGHPPTSKEEESR